jgi:hypothetical protein
MRYLSLWWLLALCLCGQATAAPLVLNAGQWAVPRRGEVVRKMPAIATAMRQLDATPGSRLIVRYPGGDEGSLWANELRGWLVALGLSSAHIELVPGSRSANTIELVVRAPLSPAPVPSKVAPAGENRS